MQTPSQHDNPHLTDAVFSNGGEMGGLMRALDWSQTLVGPVSSWPQSLRTAVRIILNSRYPMFVWWGRELVNLYNDPYRAFLGIKHPAALGKSARDVWAEIWQEIGPRAEAVLLRGEATFDEALLLLMERHGYLEETYFTFSYSPLPDDNGNIGGLFCAVTEETRKVIGERRMKLLNEIAAAMAECRTPAQVCEAAAHCLAQAQRDLPFSLIYLSDDDGQILKLGAQAGISAGHSAAPQLGSLDDASAWPFREVMETGESVVIDNLPERFADLPKGEWSQTPDSAVLLPIAHQGQKRAAGVFVAGLNPHREFGDDFRGFVSLLVNQIAGAVANTVAYETERRRAEELAELDRAKTLFFSNVSHEFRTPLTLMLGPLEDISQEAHERLGPEAQEKLTSARRNALRLLKLVNTLLDFSRIEAGRVQAIYEPTDLAQLTTEIASVFRSAMEKAGLRYSVQCETIGEAVYIDRDMWEKMVLNLLSNAFKFTFEGEVALTLKLLDGHVDLTVRDSGIGIAEDERERVFERFHRIENTRARTYEGTGIGLALVQELVRLHGGAVRVESALGKGSAFTISIPRGSAHLPAERIHVSREMASTALPPEAYVDEAERWLPRESGADSDEPVMSRLPSLADVPHADVASQAELILVADDNADMRQYLTRLLRKQYRVHVVSEGRDALQAVRELHPDLVLSDMMMPGLDGFGLIREVRRDLSVSSTPVILLSARAGEESRVEGLEAGADDYLVKPFTARELMARVATHLKIARLRRQTERARRLYDTILSNTPDLAYVFDLNHRFTYANQALLTMWGRTWDDAIGKNCLELGYPEWHAAMHDREIEQVIASRLPIRGEVPFTGTHGRRIYDYIFVPVIGPGGEVEAIAGTTRDITEHKQSEEALRRSEKLAAAGRLAATMAHEINNPLEAVVNLIYLAKGVARTEEALTYLSAAEEELGRVAHITKQTLGFYRQTQSRSQLRIGVLLNSMLAMFSSRVRYKGIAVETEMPDDPEIDAVPAEIRQVIANLLSNSIDAVGTGGRIRIRVSPASRGAGNRTRGVRLTVADNGAGIAPQLRSQLFEPFVTGNKDVGTGLGLWVCKTVVEKHGGTICVKSSNRPGKSWTVFSVFLPAKAQAKLSDDAVSAAVS